MAERDLGQKMLRLTPAHSACVKGVFLGSVGMLFKIIVLSRCMSLPADWTCSDCIFSLSGWVTGLGLGGLAPVGCLLYPPPLLLRLKDVKNARIVYLVIEYFC